MFKTHFAGSQGNILSRIHKAESHPQCVLAYQHDNLVDGVVRVSSTHQTGRAASGYRALAFNQDGSLAPCFDVERSQSCVATRQKLPAKGVIVSYHFGSMFGSGMFFITDVERRGGGSRGKTPQDLVSRCADNTDYDPNGTLSKIKTKNPELFDKVFSEGYDDVILNAHHEHGTEPLRNRHAYEEALEFCKASGIEVDDNVLRNTHKVYMRPQPMPDLGSLANQLQYHDTWDPARRRGFSCSFYGGYRGVMQLEEIDLTEASKGTVEAHKLAEELLEKYDKIVRVAVAFHQLDMSPESEAAEGNESLPAFYLFLQFSKAVSGIQLDNRSELSQLVARYASGELKAEMFMDGEDDEAEAEAQPAQEQ